MLHKTHFQVAVDLMGKGLGHGVDLSYNRFVDHSLIEEIPRSAFPIPK